MARFRVGPPYKVDPPPQATGAFKIDRASAASDGIDVTVYEGAIASVSWIPAIMRKVWLLPETDAKAAWGETTSYEELISSDNRDLQIYRFTNLLFFRVTVDISQSPPVITKAEYLSSSEDVERQYQGLSMARSFLGTKVRRLALKTLEPVFSPDNGEVAFRQVAVCRTRAPEILSNAAGLASLGSASSLMASGLGGMATSMISAGLSMPAGGGALSFGPIWTDFSLSVDAEGQCKFVMKHSYFPSTTVFVKSGNSGEFKRWDYSYDGADNARFYHWVHTASDYTPEGYQHRQGRLSHLLEKLKIGGAVKFVFYGLAWLVARKFIKRKKAPKSAS